MAIRKIKALKRYYIVSTGFSADDQIDDGEADANGYVNWDTNWPAGAEFSWFDTREQQCKHPAFYAKKRVTDWIKATKRVDGESGLDIGKMHAKKALEAERVVFDNIRDLTRLPFIEAELSMRESYTTAIASLSVATPAEAVQIQLNIDTQVYDMAMIIWTQHISEASPEAQRTAAKRELND